MLNAERLIRYARAFIAAGYSSKTCGKKKCHYYTDCKANYRLWCAINVSQNCLGLGWEENQAAVMKIAQHIKTDELTHTDILPLLDTVLGDKYAVRNVIL